MSQFAQDDQARAVRADIIKLYLDMLFAHVDWSQGGRVALLGVGEKGSSGEGGFIDRQFVDMRTPFYASVTAAHAQRWADHGRGAFIVPAVVKDGGEHDDVKLDKIMAITSICVDIDSGDVDAKANYVCQYLGRPTLAVRSGGVTERGHAKAHLYWVLSEPETEVEEVGRVRKLLAAKVGGDWSFGRATQVIRLPGSIHAKNGQAKPVTMGTPDLSREWHFDEIRQAIEDMPAMPGVEVAPDVVRLPVEPVRLPNGAWDFSAATGMPWPEEGSRVLQALVEAVSEGAVGEHNRWSTFNEVAGHYVHCARMGAMSLEEAKAFTHGWMMANMVPPWPEQRFQGEFAAMVALDVRNNGQMSGSAQTAKPIEASALAIAAGAAIEPVQNADDMLSWAVCDRTDLEPAPRIDIIKDLITAGLRHLIVAEGGAGKTMLMLDLALKIAASEEDREPLLWMGQPVTPDAVGGTVVVFTAEDGKAALNRRWAKLDPGKVLRNRAGKRLIVLPLDNTGMFQLTSKNRMGEVVPSPQWENHLAALEELQRRGHRIALVVIDTLNATLNGDENNAGDIADYMRQLSRITAGLGAAVVLVHHVRKIRDDKKVGDGDAMLDAIRGSAAIKDNVRVSIGIWRDPNYKKNLRMLGLPATDKTLYCAEVVKWNEPMFQGTKRLLRDPDSGLLVDKTKHLATAFDTTAAHQQVWMLFAIEEYAKQGMFFNKTGAGSGIYEMRHLLHPMLQKMSREEMLAMVQEMLTKGMIITRKVAGGSGSNKAVWFDMPDAPEEREAAPKGTKVYPIMYQVWRYNPSEGRVEYIDE